MNNGIISVTTSAPPDARAPLRAAVAELDAIVAEGLASGAVDRLNGVAALIEDAMGALSGGRP